MSDEQIYQALLRIESKLDRLISALADDDSSPNMTLDGTEFPGERDQSLSLG